MTKTKTNWRKDNETPLAVQTVQGVVFRPCQVPPSDHKGSFIICKVTLLKNYDKLNEGFTLVFNWIDHIVYMKPTHLNKKKSVLLESLNF